MSRTGKRPETGPEWVREQERRSRAAARGGPQRVGGWVITTDEDSGDLVLASPDRTVNLTPPPPPKADITAGIMPGLFQASRRATSGRTVPSGYSLFPAGWYDEVETTSDRMVFDPDNNRLRVESNALVDVTVLQGVVSAQAGSRQFRTTLSLAYDEDEDPTMIRVSPNAYYTVGVALVFGFTWRIPVRAGALLTPGVWASGGALNSLTGHADGLSTRFEVYRILDLPS